MSGFIANGSTAAPQTIGNDGFWPDVNPADVRTQMRIEGAVSDPRFVAVLEAAILSVNRELDAWKAQQVEAGHAALADVPALQINGASRLVLLYRRALACCAAAEIAENYRSYDATDSANQRSDDLTPSIDELRRNQRWAIRDFLGLGRVTVDLI
ncbi:head completion/stabilization protein [Stenotrophomonas sp. MMGLT7]|uniref:head completion/stabilization protein n=1 Tax=Stenotrophomonas sp. MMGLT7 TaxID=2901227 RepID=UPI001E2D247F|nr:head completion/stabilization protein [Stenotrophomonas sp. MMGLT7]MCD7096994.1 head completion/stabilization protein [Stenotrophomonas sp. MMGLT7]